MNEFVLVTGGNGFVGSNCVLQLLQKGYRVRTTVRSLNKSEEVKEMLKNGGISVFDNLEFIRTDLMEDNNWDKAAEGCDYILHVASPIFLRLPKNEDEMILPAVEGTLRVFKAAKNAGIKRIVMTSNFGAVGYSHKDKTKLITEESWTNQNEKGLSVYNKSKVLAERAAWDFIKRDGGSLELTVINPMGIFGPSLSPVLSSGFELLKNLIEGKMKRLPNITLGIVDVRDVADLHIRAMENSSAKGERFLALAGGTLSLQQIAVLLKNKMPDIAKRASTKTLPDLAVRILAIFNAKAKAVAPMVGIYRNASNEKAKRILGWNPRSNEEAIIASAESLVKYGKLK